MSKKTAEQMISDLRAENTKLRAQLRVIHEKENEAEKAYQTVCNDKRALRQEMDGLTIKLEGITEALESMKAERIAVNDTLQSEIEQMRSSLQDQTRDCGLLQKQNELLLDQISQLAKKYTNQRELYKAAVQLLFSASME